MLFVLGKSWWATCSRGSKPLMVRIDQERKERSKTTLRIPEDPGRHNRKET
jgi:hypothetical protein